MITVAQLELTLRCNHSCLYCYNPNELKGKEELSDKQWLAIVETLEARRIILTGGEPFLRKDLVLQILEANNGRDISVNTNLVIPDRDTLDRLVALGTPVMASIPTTDRDIYRRIRGSDDLQRVLGNTEYLANQGHAPTINMVVLPETVHNVRALGRLVQSLGVRTFYATPVEGSKVPGLTVGQTVRVLDSLLALQEEGLEVGITRPLPYCVVPDDEVYNQFLTRTCAVDRGLLVVGQDGTYRSCISSSQQELALPDTCGDCSTLVQCGGACRVTQDYPLRQREPRQGLKETYACHNACAGGPGVKHEPS